MLILLVKWHPAVLSRGFDVEVMRRMNNEGKIGQRMKAVRIRRVKRKLNGIKPIGGGIG